jgi:DNA replication protein DnaC
VTVWLGSACPYDLCDGSGFIVDHAAYTTQACRCRPLRIARAKASRLSAVIPKKYRGVSFDRPPVTLIEPTVVDTVRRYVANLEANLDKGQGLWLMGEVGTGKTTLAMLVSKTALEQGRSVAIYSLPKLLQEIRRTYDERAEHSYSELIDAMTSVDLLHVDDVGAERSNEWVLEQLYSVINTRYEDEKAVVLTTNLEVDELEKQIQQRTVSRLMEMCGDPLPLFGSDKRREVQIPEHLQGPARYGETPLIRLREPS